MSTLPLDDLLPSVDASVSACPLATQRRALIAAAAEFLGETHLWRVPLEECFTQPGLAEYPAAPAPIVDTTAEPGKPAFIPVRVKSVLWLVAGGHEARATMPRLLDGTQLHVSGCPAWYWMINNRELRFHPIPDAVYSFYGELALQPSRDATVLPEWVIEDWADEIADGALWRLMKTPNAAWSDLKLAAFHRQRFDRAKANAKVTDFQQINLRVHSIPFEG